MQLYLLVYLQEQQLDIFTVRRLPFNRRYANCTSKPSCRQKTRYSLYSSCCTISNVDKRMQELKVPLYPYHDIMNYTNNLIIFFDIL